MNKINPKVLLPLILMVVLSCEEPETIVTNIVHPDGSVTRKIEIRNTKNEFDKADLQVPFDNTWSVTDSLEVSSNGDTTWIKRAEKLIKNVEEINSLYQNDSSVNGKLPRLATFNKKFRWFDTEYRFSEIVEKQIQSGYSVRSFLNDEELTYFNSPDYIKYNMENGADSIQYKILADSIEKRYDNWLMKNLTSLWIEEFTRLTGPDAGPELSVKALKSKEDEICEVFKTHLELFDTLWASGELLRKFIPEEDAIKYRTEADSAVSLAVNRFLVNFNGYYVRIQMPGKLVATNGYIDSTRNLLWQVKSDFFLTDQYEMWARSKTTNVWAWIVSGVFLFFVSTGITIKRRSRRAAGPKP